MTEGKAYREAYAHKLKCLKTVVDSSDMLVTIVLNTDGLNLSQSGNRSAWPVFGVTAAVLVNRGFLSDKIINLCIRFIWH